MAVQKADIRYVLWWSLILAAFLAAVWAGIPPPALAEPTIRYKGSRPSLEGTDLVFEVKNDSGGTWSFNGDGPTRPQYNLRVDPGRWVSQWQLSKGRPRLKGGKSGQYNLAHGATVEVAVPAPQQPTRFIQLRIFFTQESAESIVDKRKRWSSAPPFLMTLLSKTPLGEPYPVYVYSDAVELPTQAEP